MVITVKLGMYIIMNFEGETTGMEFSNEYEFIKIMGGLAKKEITKKLEKHWRQ